MKRKNLLTGALLVFVAISIAFAVVKETRGSKEDTQGAQAVENGEKDFVFVHYFYGNKRCESCRKIESYTKQTLEGHFEKELIAKDIVWEAVNTDEPGNEHYIQDYQLTTKSVVLVRMKDGEPIEWKNLEQVWNLLDDEGAFEDYIHMELEGFLKTDA